MKYCINVCNVCVFTHQIHRNRSRLQESYRCLINKYLIHRFITLHEVMWTPVRRCEVPSLWFSLYKMNKMYNEYNCMKWMMAKFTETTQIITKGKFNLKNPKNTCDMAYWRPPKRKTTLYFYLHLLLNKINYLPLCDETQKKSSLTSGKEIKL